MKSQALNKILLTTLLLALGIAPASAGSTYQFRVSAAGVKPLLNTSSSSAPVLGAWSFSPAQYGASPFALTGPSSTSPGLFSYVSDNPAVAAVSGGVLSIVGVGSAGITATQASAPGFTSASAFATLIVSAAPTPSDTVWNPLDKGSEMEISATNSLVVAGYGHGVGSWQTTRASMGKSTGKFVFELSGSSNGTAPSCGLADSSADVTTQLGTSGVAIGIGGNGTIKSTMSNQTSIGFCSGTSSTRPLMFAVDLDAGKGWVAKAGVWYRGGDPVSGANPSFTFPPNTKLYPAASISTGYTYTITANFGATAFGTPVPSGFTAGWY